MNSTRVLIADDISRVRQDLRTLLTLSGNIEIVGEAENGVEAVNKSESLRPEVVLLDLEMPVMDGLEATRQIKTSRPDCRVIVLTIHGGQAERKGAYLAGADFFLEKGTPLDILLEAIYEKNKPDSLSEGGNHEKLN